MPFDKTKLTKQATGLKKDVLAIIAIHIGANNPIKADEIAGMVGLKGKYRDRRVREAIKMLRRDGCLILSSVGKNPGYFLAANEVEWKEFRDGNLRPRALDILETSRAMTRAAQREFGGQAGLNLPDMATIPPIQLKLVA
jgi:hypothetical protein